MNPTAPEIQHSDDSNGEEVSDAIDIVECNPPTASESVKSKKGGGYFEFEVGDVVSVQPRTWPGINKLGGMGRISKVNPDRTYNVQYILGGSERSIEAKYIKREAIITNSHRKIKERQFFSDYDQSKQAMGNNKKRTMTYEHRGRKARKNMSQNSNNNSEDSSSVASDRSKKKARTSFTVFDVVSTPSPVMTVMNESDPAILVASMMSSDTSANKQDAAIGLTTSSNPISILNSSETNATATSANEPEKSLASEIRSSSPVVQLERKSSVVSITKEVEFQQQSKQQQQYHQKQPVSSFQNDLAQAYKNLAKRNTEVNTGRAIDVNELNQIFSTIRNHPDYKLLIEKQRQQRLDMEQRFSDEFEHMKASFVSQVADSQFKNAMISNSNFRGLTNQTSLVS